MTIFTLPGQPLDLREEIDQPIALTAGQGRVLPADRTMQVSSLRLGSDDNTSRGAGRGLVLAALLAAVFILG